MNTTIQIFENNEFGAIRTMSNEQGEPLFCGKDVCNALGYSNSREALRKHVEKDDVTKRDTIDSVSCFTTTQVAKGMGCDSRVVCPNKTPAAWL